MHKHEVDTFNEKSTVKAVDLDHRTKINFNIAKYNAVVPVGKSQFSNVELAREKAKNLKWKVMEKLDRYLEQFEDNFTRNGGKVIWAENAEQAQEAILKICKEKKCRSVVKSKSMATEGNGSIWNKIILFWNVHMVKELFLHEPYVTLQRVWFHRKIFI